METIGAVLQALLIIVFVGGLSLLAHWGRKNRAAEITLIVVILFASFLVLALGALVALAGAIGDAGTSLALLAGSAAFLALAGLAGFAICVPPLLEMSRQRASAAPAGPDDFAQGSHAFATTTGYAPEGAPEGRGSGLRWSDPPTYFALWVAVITLATNAVFLLAFTLRPEETNSLFTSTGRISPVTVVLGQLPFVVVAFLGVGFGIRRDFRQSLSRLGYGPITLPQLGVVALCVVAALLLSLAADALFAALQPDLYERVGEISDGIFGPQGLTFASAVLFALLIGVGAGLGEETLFRGALQPALGIPLTSVLWASLHIQYGPSVLLGYIFVLSIGLGYLRNRINTTATFLVHAGYNASGVLLAYFFGV